MEEVGEVTEGVTEGEARKPNISHVLAILDATAHTTGGRESMEKQQPVYNLMPQISESKQATLFREIPDRITRTTQQLEMKVTSTMNVLILVHVVFIYDKLA